MVDGCGLNGSASFRPGRRDALACAQVYAQASSGKDKQAALVPAESGENALQLSLRSRMKPGWPLAGLLTCASPNFDSPSQGLRPSGLKHRVKTLRAYSYGVVTDLHRLPSTRLKRGYPGWVPGSNFWRSNGGLRLLQRDEQANEAPFGCPCLQLLWTHVHTQCHTARKPYTT